jgi:hypothetical protein
VTTPAIRFSYAVVVAFFACLAIALASVVYTNHVQGQAERRARMERAESDRRWCALLNELDGAYSAPPGPTTETGRKVAIEVHQLRADFGCVAD